ncbi:hypothetical protein ENSA5_07100 [Enhygromyxa salina]|uniref:Outer membrane lipoprotein carrier protein LolA n=1 Tax=Enhygromyxa salina TaxID=215803 RepID=A0A2S9YH98_9BACT|nr:hypothetical protein [Enhygromyxa salina]PRQ04479.1 hypothetical protein ENSA5_07100 [Enhygromyxa salina]
MNAKLSRRALISSGAAGLGILALALTGRAAPAAPVDRAARRLANRLELWRTFASKSHNLLARYTSTRTSPLLVEELVESGSLAFVAPGTLVLRDDGVTGSTTRIEPGAVAIVPNDPSLPRRALPQRDEAPALRWLADHLVACLAPGDGAALTADARVEVPRGSTPRLSLMPPRDSAARALIRSVTLTFDQVGGAVIRIEIAESDGGSFTLKISDHRQEVEPEMLARVLQ